MTSVLVLLFRRVDAENRSIDRDVGYFISFDARILQRAQDSSASSEAVLYSIKVILYGLLHYPPGPNNFTMQRLVSVRI